MKHFFVRACLIVTAFLAGKAPAAAPPATKQLSLGISQIVEHPSLNELRLGIVAGLEKEGFGKDRLHITYANAQGDMVTSNQIARKLAGDNHDVLIGISTPSTQGLIATRTKTPIVFTGVNDPVSAKFVKDLNTPSGRVSGVMLASPVKEQLAMILEVLPHAKKIGILYSAGEANSVSVVEQFSQELKAAGKQAVPVAVNNSAQVQAAAQSLVGRADAVYVPTDNTVVSAIGAVVQVAAANRLPLFSADNASVAAGALGALGVDHHAMGLETAKMVARILRGDKIETMPVVIPRDYELHLNRKYCKEMGVTFPASLVARARKVYD